MVQKGSKQGQGNNGVKIRQNKIKIGQLVKIGPNKTVRALDLPAGGTLCVCMVTACDPLSTFEPILTHAAGIWRHTGPQNTGNTPKSVPNLAANGGVGLSGLGRKGTLATLRNFFRGAALAQVKNRVFSGGTPFLGTFWPF